MSAAREKAWHLYRTERYGEAERAALEALAEEPEDAHATGLLALARSRQGRHDEAIEDAGRAVGLAPEWPWIHATRARVHWAAGRAAEALEAARESVRLSPADPDGHALLADLLYRTGDGPAATAAVEAALRLDPGCVDARETRVCVLNETGRMAECEEECRALLRLAPESSTAHSHLARCLLRRGDAEGAVAAYRDALRIAPSYEWARRGLLTALRARYPLYGRLHRLLEWVRGLPPGARMVAAGGVYLLLTRMGGMAKSVPGLRPFVIAIVTTYVALALASWVADPLLNLALLARRDTRRILTPEEARGSVVVAVLVFSAAGMALAGALGVGAWAWMAALLVGVGLPGATASLGFVGGTHGGSPAGRTTIVLTIVGGVAGIAGLATLALAATQGFPRVFGVIAYVSAIFLLLAIAWRRSFLGGG